ncbi:MAG: 2Fe-2S iron-sulfur cluster-binding protein, partial [Eubacteriales bacterium]|nr:2Fe-2S iron-sulfur cluster-binding protein [Eubacteriales bacterium]
MVNLTINKQKISVPEGTTIMDAAAQAGINVPHLCFLKDINEIGACRVCLVEIKGLQKLATSCNTVAEEGMEIITNSPRVRKARKANVELILSEHDCLCTTCVRSGNCSLQSVANDLDILHVPYIKNVEENRWDKT